MEISWEIETCQALIRNITCTSDYNTISINAITLAPSIINELPRRLITKVCNKLAICKLELLIL